MMRKLGIIFAAIEEMMYFAVFGNMGDGRMADAITTRRFPPRTKGRVTTTACTTDRRPSCSSHKAARTTDHESSEWTCLSNWYHLSNRHQESPFLVCHKVILCS